jgi:hypothetical protein
LSADRIETLTSLLKDEVSKISATLNPMEYAARNKRPF